MPKHSKSAGSHPTKTKSRLKVRGNFWFHYVSPYLEAALLARWVVVLPVILILIFSQIFEEQSAPRLSPAPPPARVEMDQMAVEINKAVEAMDLMSKKAAMKKEEAKNLLESVKAMEKDEETVNSQYMSFNATEAVTEHVPGERIPDRDSYGHNTALMSQLLFGMFRSREIRSVLDLTCRRNAEWIRPVLRAIIAVANDGFRYYCLEEDEAVLKETIPLFKGFQSIYFIRRNITSMRLPQTSVVLMLDILQTSTVDQGVQILENVKKNAIPLALISHNPGKTNPARSPTDLNTPSIGSSSFTALNIKAAPFGLGPPKAVFGDLLPDYSHKGYPAQVFLLNTTTAIPFDVQLLARF